jgi:hypothetical protein
MSDELTEPTVTTEEVTEEAQEQPESIDPELLELVKSLDPETLKNAKNLDEFYKRVNRMSMDVAEERKRLDAERAKAPSPTAAADDSDDGLDEKARRIIDARVEAVLKSTVLPYMEQERKDTERKVWENFTNDHKDVPADAIAEKFYELGLDQTSTTSAKFAAALEKAYKVAKADSLDVDALVTQKVAERLAELKESGGEVVEVKQKKSAIEASPKTSSDIVNDTELTWVDKLALLAKG